MSWGQQLTTSLQTLLWPLLSQLATLVSLHSLRSPLFLSPPLSLSSLSFRKGSHSMPFCCLFWFFSSPCPCCWAPALLSPVCIYFPCSASPSLPSSRLGWGGLELPLSMGRGEPLSCTHGVDQKRLEFSGSGSALDAILIKPRCLVKQ